MLEANMTAEYFPAVFDVADMQRAKEIILTQEGPGADTETRWAEETPYVLELIREAFELQSEMVVLDYGCGIGRMARAMIEATGCSVIGVDTRDRRGHQCQHAYPGARIRGVRAFFGGFAGSVRYFGASRLAG
jgi:cyclopropane fatty-acyl-phospholipid synthase-like methyltransferase